MCSTCRTPRATPFTTRFVEDPRPLVAVRTGVRPRPRPGPDRRIRPARVRRVPAARASSIPVSPRPAAWSPCRAPCPRGARHPARQMSRKTPRTSMTCDDARLYSVDLRRLSFRCLLRVHADAGESPRKVPGVPAAHDRSLGSTWAFAEVFPGRSRGFRASRCRQLRSVKERSPGGQGYLPLVGNQRQDGCW